MRLVEWCPFLWKNMFSDRVACLMLADNPDPSQNSSSVHGKWHGNLGRSVMSHPLRVSIILLVLYAFLSAVAVSNWRRGAFIAAVTLTSEFVFFLFFIPYQMAFAATLLWIHSRAEQPCGAGKRAIELLPLASSLAWAPLLIAFLLPRIPSYWGGWLVIGAAAFLQGLVGAIVLAKTRPMPNTKRPLLAIAFGVVSCIVLCPYYYLLCAVYLVLEVPANVGSIVGRLW